MIRCQDTSYLPAPLSHWDGDGSKALIRSAQNLGLFRLEFFIVENPFVVQKYRGVGGEWSVW